MYSQIDTLIFDLNGTLYERGLAVEGAVETLKALRQAGYHLNFVTNTDGRPVAHVLKRLNQMGFDIQPDELVTPVSAVKHKLEQEPHKTSFLLVHDQVLQDLGHLNQCDQSPDYVVVGDFSDKVSYDLLNKAFRLVRAGAQIISMSNTLWYVDKEGDSINTGAFVHMLETATATKALLMGKPSKSFFEMALVRTKSSPATTMVIGDDLLTDIVGGSHLGATTVQVKTGVYAVNTNKQEGILADCVIPSVVHLLEILDVKN